MDNENTKEWFQDIETVVSEPLVFKAKLAIGEDAYTSLRLKNKAYTAYETLGVAGAAVVAANSTVVASTFFAPTGWLAAIGIGTAVTPLGWVVAAGVVTGGAWLGVSRYLKNVSGSRVTVIPNFINTPMDVLALGLFDLIAPLVLKIAVIDGDFHKTERDLIESYFVKQWGYNQDFVREGMAYSATNLSQFSIEASIRELAEFQKENPDCNFKAMSKEMLRFLREIVEADGKLDAREENAIASIESIIKDVGEPIIQKKARKGWKFISNTVNKSIAKKFRKTKPAEPT